MNNTVKINFDKFYSETGRAYLIRIEGQEMWLPKKMCWSFTTNKKLGGWCVIPEWLYREKFNREPSEEEMETVIYHHTPEKIEKVVSNEINELKK